MSAIYQREMDFAVNLLKRMRLSVRFIQPEDTLLTLDNELRLMLGMESDYLNTAHILRSWSRSQTVYTIQDHFLCHYIFFQLPEQTPDTWIVIGPYLTLDPSEEVVLELSERLRLPRHFAPHLMDYYAAQPVFHDPAVIMTVISTLCETLFGGSDAFNIVDINDDGHLISASIPTNAPIEQENILLRMAQIEERYAYENKLMESVSKGLVNQAEMMMSSVSSLNFQSRTADPLRNMKNYCIICNTLLRKAAQDGGVHPFHLDMMSSDFARQIEHLPTVEKASALIGDMIRAYCRLVRTHTSSSYSAVIQKAIAYIDANLSLDLTLNGLAEMLQISPGYLSTLFHRETGHTLAHHITMRRMKAAVQLLKNTHLQIQTVAQLSGFPDPNYFGKQFKRIFGITPLQFKKEQPGTNQQNDT